MSPAEEASFLGALFDSKQYREVFQVPLSCFPEPTCRSLASRASVVKRHLLELQDSNDGKDPLGTFPIFYENPTDVLTHKLSHLLGF